jgi:hypothetical protein
MHIATCWKGSGLTCAALPVETTEDEKASEYEEDIEYGDKH